MDRLTPFTELLVLRAQAGDRDAFARLAALWHPRLLRHANHLCEHIADDRAEWARDATQEAWLSIARSIGRLQDTRAFGPWAKRIVARRVADRLRLAKRDRKTSRHHTHETQHTASQPKPDRSNPAHVRLALATLSHQDRALLAMAHAREMSVAAIASATNTKPGTVKSRLHRARQRAHEAIERIERDETPNDR